MINCLHSPVSGLGWISFPGDLTFRYSVLLVFSHVLHTSDILQVLVQGTGSVCYDAQKISFRKTSEPTVLLQRESFACLEQNEITLYVF